MVMSGLLPRDDEEPFRTAIAPATNDGCTYQPGRFARCRVGVVPVANHRLRRREVVEAGESTKGPSVASEVTACRRRLHVREYVLRAQYSQQHDARFPKIPGKPEELASPVGLL